MNDKCCIYDCSNRNYYGYCKTTVCINPKYNKIINSIGYGGLMYRKFVQDEVLDNGIIKGHMESIKTNADRIRSMTDEELAKYLAWLVDKQTCSPEWLIWLKDEVKT